MDALQPLDDLLHFHAFHQTAHPLCVAVAASIELDVVDASVNDFEFNHLTAGALRIISVFHSEIDLAAKVRIIIKISINSHTLSYLRPIRERQKLKILGIFN